MKGGLIPVTISPNAAASRAVLRRFASVIFRVCTYTVYTAVVGVFMSIKKNSLAFTGS